MPHTLYRIFGENIKDGAQGAQKKLHRFDKETFQISRFLDDILFREDTADLDDSFMHKLLKHVPPFTLLIPMLSLQQEDIEGEIEYLKSKVDYLQNFENMDGN